MGMFTVGASLLAKNVNDNAGNLDARSACEFFASKLAPTVSTDLKLDFVRFYSFCKRPGQRRIVMLDNRLGL